MERKHKIFIGIAIAIAIVLIFLIWYFYRQKKDLLTQITALKAEIVALQAAIEASEGSSDVVVGLQRQLEECSAKLINLQKQLDQTNEEKKTQIAQLSQQIAAQTAQSAANGEKITQLTATVNQLNANLSACNSTIDSLKAEISGLKTANSSLTTQVKDLEVKLSTEVNNLSKCNDKITSLNATINSNVGTINNLNAKITSLNTTINTQTELITKITTERDNLVKQLASAETTINTLNANIATLTTTNVSLSAQVSSLQNQINSGPAVGDLQAQLNAAISDRDALKASLNALKSQYDALTINYNKCMTDKAALTAQISSLNLTVTTLTSERDKLKADMSNSQLTITNLNTTITTLKSSIETLNVEMGKLQTDIKTVTTERDQLKAQVVSLTSQLTSRDEKITTLTAQLATLNTDLSAIKVSYDTLMKSVRNFGLLPVIPYYLLSTSAGKCASVLATGDVVIVDCVTGNESLQWTYNYQTGLITSGSFKLVAAGGSSVKAVDNATNVGSNDQWGATSSVSNTSATNNDRRIYSNGTIANGNALGIIGNILAVVSPGVADVIFTNRIPGSVAQIPDVGGATGAICPTGYENINGLCVQSCPSGYTPILWFCFSGCGTGWKGSETPTHCIKQRLLSTPKAPDACNAGSTYKDGLCYLGCPAGSSNDWGQVLSCRSNCPTTGGWQQLANTCYLPPDSFTRDTLAENKIGFNYACPSGYSYINGLCYRDCPSGYSRDFGQMSCRKNCPGGYTQYANTCTAGATGYTPDIKSNIAPWDACPGGYFRPTAGEWRCVQNCASGYYWNGSQCWRDPNTISREDLGSGYSTGVGQTTSCPSGYDKLATGCYKSCPSGYTRDSGQLTCRKVCPSDYRQDPNYCVRDTKSTTRTQVATLPAGSMPICPAGTQNVDGLCYPPCPSGYARIPGIPLNCGQVCPPNSTDIGLACQKDMTLRNTKSASEIGVCPDGKKNVAGWCI
ncbi:hypothetical protein PRJ_Fausto_00163 [Faustovirus]|nr:hypothetical protein PRJ_Fausto_00163 [Faustovirus]AMN84090.1 hypothetical protein D5a_00176 [Faustovirus]QBR99076.1 growth factor receptor cystein-rich domain-containing protein [Faustovirus mariensis]